MSTNYQSQALQDTPGYVDRPSSAPAVTPNFPALPSVPQLAPLDARAPNTASRDWLLQQLGPLATQQNAALTNIQAGAKLQLAGYGGWKFGVDNPATPQREDLELAFDASSGPGEKEKQAFRAEDNSMNSRGLLFSSFRNQGIASAAQRLSLEGQQYANQYAFNLNQAHTSYAGQVASIANQWVNLYGADTLWLAENPPAPPPPPPAPPPPTAAQQAAAQIPGAPAGYSIGGTYATPNINGKTLDARFGANNWFITPWQGKYVVLVKP